MSKNFQSYLRWLNMMVNDEDERKEMQIERYATGGAKVLNPEGGVMLNAVLEGNTWKILGDDGIYVEEYSLSNSGAWTPEQAEAFKLVEQVLSEL